MSKENWLDFDWVKKHYDGIYEIYPQRCFNSATLEIVLRSMCKNNYRLVKIHEGWIRAFEQK